MKDHRPTWPFWLLFVIAFSVIGLENVGNFAVSVPNLIRESGGLKILDMRLWYSSADAYQLFDALGPSGRADNLLLYLTVDIAIPLLSSMLLWSAISRGSLGRFRELSLLGGAFDYLENISILILLANYPAQLDALVIVAACFTLLKFLFYFVAIALAVVGFILKLKKSDT